ncbi:protein inscuteable homolog [Agrilus planipennis]|uniref:Protein inscuteable homolog n=1 Tax=Agrilus planipennis TaxID=224129 RepID=A0A1W4WZW6_AGRPL|nr:protein inscuteable homolog [Agrilus planipennis]XP_018325699.1 protein inscuteable homolog [Agrilus planipennis]XP_018325700.1 protein inscuteable homolog [Agrilus planipennis]
MKKFQRSPSKVWWGEEALNWSQRSTSSSSGSQDSGFSDTETSSGHLKKREPSPGQPSNGETSNQFRKDILKDITSSQNLSSNFKEKSTPKKTSPFYTQKKENNPSNRFSSIEEGEDLATTACACISSNKHVVETEVVNNRVNRNLFKNLDANETARDLNVEDDSSEFSEPCDNNNRTVSDHDEIPLQFSECSIDNVDGCKTYPFLSVSPYVLQKNNSAPALIDHPEVTEPVSNSLRRSSLSSSDESELELLFNENLLGSPKHSSTPKGQFRKEESMRHRRAKHLYQKYQNERILRRRMRFENENASVQKWLEEVREIYDPECMIMLQCKSVAGDLSQKVSHLANMLTCPLRKLLYMGENIEKEFDNIKSQSHYSAPLAQSLTGHISEFACNFVEGNNELIIKCEEIRRATLEELPSLTDNLYSNWNLIFQEILVKYLKKLVCYLEDPRSELELRATLTAVTSLTLRNESFAEIFTSCDTISTLCVLCEKCEGSTVRALVLRALSTICNNSPALKQFERCSGIQMITEILTEDSRPEPERAEALALLAQATAPWIEDNRNLKTLYGHIKPLVKAITHFITTTRCCQNLLLCAAALANISSLEPKSIKYILNQNSIRYLLECIKERGPEVSIYILEQIAIILANVSSKQEAREQMIEENVVRILLYFLQATSDDKYAVQRIQQKAIVALSRLSGNKKAAEQLVEQGGISKLANLCRDKEKRYDSDAVLVAALATLRKVAEICGTATIGDEDLQELVQPRLLDSFLTYSAQNESYV